jgi:hypothetical protein
MRRSFLLAIACLALSACWGNGEPTPPSAGTGVHPADTGAEPDTEPAVEPIALVPMRPSALRRCRKFPELAELCPLQVPEGRYGPGSGAYETFSDRPSPGVYGATFNLGQGGEDPRRPERNRPPALVHLIVTAAPPFPTGLPKRVKLRDGLMEERRRKPLYLGPATWGGHEGVLLLAPPYPLGGLQSNHLIFSWDLGSKAVSLHAWEPLTEVPDVLRAVVESIPDSG